MCSTWWTNTYCAARDIRRAHYALLFDVLSWCTAWAVRVVRWMWMLREQCVVVCCSVLQCVSALDVDVALLICISLYTYLYTYTYFYTYIYMSWCPDTRRTRYALHTWRAALDTQHCAAFHVMCNIVIVKERHVVVKERHVVYYEYIYTLITWVYISRNSETETRSSERETRSILRVYIYTHYVGIYVRETRRNIFGTEDNVLRFTYCAARFT